MSDDDQASSESESEMLEPESLHQTMAITAADISTTQMAQINGSDAHHQHQLRVNTTDATESFMVDVDEPTVVVGAHTHSSLPLLPATTESVTPIPIDSASAAPTTAASLTRRLTRSHTTVPHSNDTDTNGSMTSAALSGGSFSDYLSTLPPLQPMVRTTLKRTRQATEDKEQLEAFKAYKKEIKKLPLPKLLQECETLYFELTNLKNEQTRFRSRFDWSDAVDMHSVEISTDTSVAVSYSSQLVPERNAAAVPSEFIPPKQPVCKCQCDCITALTCYCKCDQTASNNSATATSSFTAVTFRCHCKCHCAQPLGWPRHICYTQLLNWSDIPIPSLSSAALSNTSSNLFNLLQDRISNTLDPETSKISSRFSLKASNIVRGELGLFALKPVRQGEIHLMDVSGNIRISDRRKHIKYDLDRWQNIPFFNDSQPSSSNHLIELFGASYDLPFQIDIDTALAGNESRFIQSLVFPDKRRGNVTFTTYFIPSTGERRLRVDCIKDIAIGEELVLDPIVRKPIHLEIAPSSASSEKRKRHHSTDLTNADDQLPLAELVKRNKVVTPISIPSESEADPSSRSVISPNWTVRPSDHWLCCTICKRAYAEQVSFDYHWHKLHSTQYACTKCAYRAGNATKLQEHQAKHRRNETTVPVPPATTAATLTPRPNLSIKDEPISVPSTPKSIQVLPTNVMPAKPVLATLIHPEKKRAIGHSKSRKPVTYTPDEWQEIQAKRATIRQKCTISEPMLFGTELMMHPVDEAIQTEQLQTFLKSPTSVKFHETFEAEPVTRLPPKATDASSLSSFIFILPRECYAVHDLAPGIRVATKTPLLGIPILSPASQFTPSIFQLPKEFGCHRLARDSAEGWGVTFLTLKKYQRREFETDDDEEPTEEKKEGDAASSTTKSKSLPTQRKRMKSTMPSKLNKSHQAWLNRVGAINPIAESNADLRYTIEVTSLTYSNSYAQTSPHNDTPSSAGDTLANGSSSSTPFTPTPIVYVHKVHLVRVFRAKEVIGVYVVAKDIAQFMNLSGGIQFFTSYDNDHRTGLWLPPTVKSAPIPKRCILLSTRGLLKFCTRKMHSPSPQRAASNTWLLQVIMPRMVQLQEASLEYGTESVWRTQSPSDPTMDASIVFWKKQRKQNESSATSAIPNLTPPSYAGPPDDEATEDELDDSPPALVPQPSTNLNFNQSTTVACDETEDEMNEEGKEEEEEDNDEEAEEAMEEEEVDERDEIDEHKDVDEEDVDEDAIEDAGDDDRDVDSDENAEDEDAEEEPDQSDANVADSSTSHSSTTTSSASSATSSPTHKSGGDIQPMEIDE